MIGTLMKVTTSDITRSGQWPYPTDATTANSLPERDVRLQASMRADGPTINTVSAQPVRGLRGIITTVVRGGIPLLPRGPALLTGRKGPQVTNRGGKRPNPVATVATQQYDPAPTLEQLGDWYGFLV